MINPFLRVTEPRTGAQESLNNNNQFMKKLTAATASCMGKRIFVPDSGMSVSFNIKSFYSILNPLLAKFLSRVRPPVASSSVATFVTESEVELGRTRGAARQRT